MVAVSQDWYSKLVPAAGLVVLHPYSGAGRWYPSFITSIFASTEAWP